MPRVSVIMSVYKEPIEWLKQSIDSILNQSFKDFEFIIVNDCPDREENSIVLNDFAKKNPRIVIISNDENSGLTKSLNKALSMAKGEYIARMDADDISMPQRFDRQVTYLDGHPNISAVGSWIVYIDESGKQVSNVVKYDTDPRWVKAQFLQNSQLCHPSAMFRRIVKDHVVRYDESVRYAQDYALWVSILPYGDIANIPEVLLNYRTSSKQITSNKRDEQQECAGITQRKAFALFDFPVTEQFLKLFFTMTVQHQMDLPFDEVTMEFCRFFKEAKQTKDNSLALEIIYSTYLAYLQRKSGAAKIRFIKNVTANSSVKMLWIGFKLTLHLAQRKANRK